MLDERRRRVKAGGFTLIELLIVVAIIGIIAAILIPNLMDSLQKAKQKRTLADLRLMGTAWFSWYTDQQSGSAAGAAENWTWGGGDLQDYDYADLLNLLRPSDTMFYLQTLPRRDGWGSFYSFQLSASMLTGSTLSYHNVMAIGSPGRDGVLDAGTYVAGPFVATDYDQDMIWADGYLVRFPGGVDSSGSSP